MSAAHPIAQVRTHFVDSDNGLEYDRIPEWLMPHLRNAFAAGRTFAGRHRGNDDRAVDLVEMAALSFDGYGANDFERALLRAVYCAGVMQDYHQENGTLSAEGFPIAAAVMLVHQVTQALLLSTVDVRHDIECLPATLEIPIPRWRDQIRGIHGQAIVLRAARRVGLVGFRPTYVDDSHRKVDLLIADPHHSPILAVQVKSSMQHGFRIRPLWDEPTERRFRGDYRSYKDALRLWLGVKHFRKFTYADTVPVLVQIGCMSVGAHCLLGEKLVQAITRAIS